MNNSDYDRSSRTNNFNDLDIENLKINEEMSNNHLLDYVENNAKDNLKKSVDEYAVSLIIIGMAGSGKTTFVQKLVSELNIQKKIPYVVNLDPAVYKVPYPVNIDIRESVRFKQVMQQYKLGPNGAIVTCLNLFATKFNQVYDILEQRKIQHKHMIFDTPGQIEIFTWSASGCIISDSLATLSPTVLVYVIDSEKSMNPTTFMSNMLHACSVMYRSRVPLVVVLNKIDLVDYKQILGWINDFEKFEQAIDAYNNNNNNDGTYILNLVRSLNLVLDEFYCKLKCVGVSSITGQGMDQFIDHIIPCAIDEYNNLYYSTHHHDSSEFSCKSSKST